VQTLPPFRLARSPATPEAETGSGTYMKPSPDACCAAPSDAQLRSLKRRAKLSELDSHLHCSIIGTCLSTSELRKLVPKFTLLDRHSATDLEIHHAAVELAIDGGAGCKALQKALDTRYAVALRKFESAKDPDALEKLWEEALKSGDIPPAYWAVMTHPQATLSVRQAAFGELHMLSHLVGAANRADIRRLVALEEENAALKEKVERQQTRLHEMGAQRDASIRELNDRLATVSTQSRRASDAGPRELQAEVMVLREALAARDDRLAIHMSRREAAEQRALDEQNNAQALSKRLDDVLATLTAVQADCAALEQAMTVSTDSTASQQTSLSKLSGKRVVYVGGRPGSNAVLRQIVESAGGDFVVHDGGIEDRKGAFAAALPKADIVVFPVDCVDHDSMNLLKRVCDRHQVDYHPVRTASVASFVELMVRLGQTSTATSTRPVSRFCLRHG
jgi:Uncharacterized protein conserved in bacteria (DUF2325)